MAGNEHIHGPTNNMCIQEYTIVHYINYDVESPTYSWGLLQYTYVQQKVTVLGHTQEKKELKDDPFVQEKCLLDLQSPINPSSKERITGGGRVFI